jgi:hypothetical protein
MKKIFTLLIGIVFSIAILNAQAPPQAFTYMAIIRKSNGQALVNKTVSFRSSILEVSSNGSVVYVETFKPLTDGLGQINIEIGHGTPEIGIFSEINWSSAKHYLKTEVDITGGTNYAALSTTQLLSVPYALFSGESEIALSADYNNLLNKPLIPTIVSQLTNDAGYLTSEVDGSVSNELQTLSIDGNVISLSQGGGSVTIPSISSSGGQYYYLDKDGDAYGDNYYPVWVPTGVTPPANFINNSSDCKDNNPAINPGAIEICGNGIDENCDGIDACNTNVDADGDGYMISQGDCADNDPNIHPGALEICDYIDNDCDGQVDEPPMPNCVPPQNMTFTGCNSGMCQFGCLPGWWDLDGDQSNGCESSIPLELSIGDDFRGGKVAYILQPGDPRFDANVQHGLIAAPSDQSNGAEWGCWGTDISGADGTAIGTGAQNTNEIVADCATAGIAAKLCSDLVLNGYSDWYLPSKDELNKLYINRTAIGGFTNYYYWSSSEALSEFAWAQHFNYSDQGQPNKLNTFHVRAVRAF